MRGIPGCSRCAHVSSGKKALFVLLAALLGMLLYADVSVANKWNPGRRNYATLLSQTTVFENGDLEGGRECNCYGTPTSAIATVASTSSQTSETLITAWEAVKRAPYQNGMRRKCIVGSFGGDWEHIEYLILNSSTPFAIARYGDGERNLIKGLEISQSTQAFSQDKFWFEGGDSELGKDLALSLTGHFGEQFYYGFASPRDDGAGLHWYLEHTEQLCPFITYANLFVNHNYPRTKALVEHLLATRLNTTVLIANHESVARFLTVYSAPPGFRTMSLPDDAPHVYKGEGRIALLANATALAKSVNGFIFLVAGGPMAKPMVAHMWQANPTNQYVDFGSSLDELLKGRQTRPYMNPGTSYAQQIDPHFTVDDLDRPVVVNYDYMGG